MILCISDCTTTKCLAAPNRCEETQTLTIGTMPDNNQDYWVYIYDETRDKLTRIEATSDNAGELVIDLVPLAGKLNPYSIYYIFVTQEGANMSEREDITIDGETYTCLKVEFAHPFNDSNEQVVITNQTISI